MKATKPHTIMPACFQQVLWLLGIVFGAMALPYAASEAQDQATQVIRGTVAAVSNDVYTIKTDGGGPVQVQFAASTNIERLEPGSTDLKSATPTTAGTIAVGDRVLLSGSALNPGSIIARVIYVMKASDIQQKNAAEEADWQRRGIGGPVRSVDSSTNSIIISVVTATGAKNITVLLTPKTQLMRYAADSVKFSDAKLEPISSVQVGDQLRVLGDRNTDGNVVTADEIVTGSFRNISGLITGINAPANTFTVMNLSTKRTIIVVVTSNTDMRKLAMQVAAQFAVRLKSGQNDARNGSGHSASSELMQLVNKMPSIGLADLHTGDALMIAATASETSNSVTAITVLAGVEPILTASPNKNEMTLEPWSLNSGSAPQ